MSGTRVAIALGDALVQAVVASLAPQDTVDDLMRLVDDAIVYAMRHGSSELEKQEFESICKEIAEAAAVAAVCASEVKMRMEARSNADSAK